MKDRRFRVGLIGFGLGGASFHAPLIQATQGLELTHVVTANPERQAQARAAIPGVTVLPNADALWANAGDLDLVVISTPNRSHAPLALRALEVGLAVVIDKPFALSADEAQQVIESAHARKLPLSVYHIRRWDSECRTLQSLMAQNALGRILRFESRMDRWRPEPKGSWKERGVTEEGGGLLYDIGSHLIDQALYLFGPVREVYAELDQRRQGVESDDDLFVALAHENGVRAHLWASVLAAEPGPRMRVMGDRAAFVKQLGDVQEAALRAGGRADRPGWGEEPPERWGILSDGVTQRPVKSEPGAYQKFYEGMVRCLRDGAPPPVDPQDAVRGLEIIEAARRSAAERRVVPLG
ncbi:MAG TPA: Gfo/Idh/MocA family oxidoreductase [Rhizomicrobium sp.]|nr:Gfo/Idh/MocA family oxidoreductase [Rhizomicrobium sp.]